MRLNMLERGRVSMIVCGCSQLDLERQSLTSTLSHFERQSQKGPLELLPNYFLWSQ
jgi:hypothetical protein